MSYHSCAGPKRQCTGVGRCDLPPEFVAVLPVFFLNQELFIYLQFKPIVESFAGLRHIQHVIPNLCRAEAPVRRREPLRLVARVRRGVASIFINLVLFSYLQFKPVVESFSGLRHVQHVVPHLCRAEAPVRRRRPLRLVTRVCRVVVRVRLLRFFHGSETF